MIVSVPLPLPNASLIDSNNSGSKSNLSPKLCRRERSEIFRVNVGHSLRTVLDRYERVQAMKDCYSILSLCDNLRVSPSGFYDWQKRQNSPGPRAREDETLAREIREIHQRSRQTYGSPRIVTELRKNG